MPPVLEVSSKPKFEELLLTMDAVDQLRAKESELQKYAQDKDQKVAIKAKLLSIYQSQGITVSDETLEKGIEAHFSGRFVYNPPKGFARTVALAWIHRTRMALLGGIGALGIALLAIGTWSVLVLPGQNLRREQSALTERLNRDRSAEHTNLSPLESLYNEAKTAIASGKTKEANAKIAELETYENLVSAQLSFRIVDRSGTKSGVVWKSRNDPNSRDYYLIVEAVDAQNNPRKVPITDRITQRKEWVSTFGVSVPQAVFDRYREEKIRTGLIHQPVIGQKARGQLAPKFSIPTNGGFINTWR